MYATEILLFILFCSFKKFFVEKNLMRVFKKKVEFLAKKESKVICKPYLM